MLCGHHVHCRVSAAWRQRFAPGIPARVEACEVGFTAGGLVGFTTLDEMDPDGRSNARVVRIDQSCDLLAAAEKKTVISVCFFSITKREVSSL